MKIINVLILLVILVFITEITYSQTTTGSNVRPATSAFNGWDGSGSNPGQLDIKNLFTNQDIYIWNNDGTTTSIRMTISGSTEALYTNNVGIGPNFTTP